LASTVDIQTMRRSNRPSGYSAAAPPGHIQRSSHLDIPSSHDDEPSDKLHKSKRRGNKSKIVMAVVGSLVALGTLIYVANLVANGGGASLLQLGKRSHAAAAIHNIKNKMKHHQHHHHEEARVQTASMSQAESLLPPDSIYRSTIIDIHGVSQNLSQYAGYISLIVNVACE